jgi:hypothetical protein
MAENDIALMAHLMRRAGFGAPYDNWRHGPPRGTRRRSRNSCIPKTSRMVSTWMCWNGTLPNGRG